MKRGGRTRGPLAVAAAALAAALALAPGCSLSSFERRPPEKQRFMLAPPTAAESAQPLAGVLRVERVRVSPSFDNKGFVYRTGESTFESDFYNEFFMPPGALLREALIQWLTAAHLFSSVDHGSTPEPDWLLETDVEQLFADRRKSDQQQGVLAIGFRVLDARTRKPRLEKRYSAAETATDASPAGLVAAWNRALGSVLRELDADLRSSSARPGGR